MSYFGKAVLIFRTFLLYSVCYGQKGDYSVCERQKQIPEHLVLSNPAQNKRQDLWSQEVSSSLIWSIVLWFAKLHIYTAILKNFVFRKKYFHLNLSCLRCKIVPYLVLRYFILQWMERRKWCPAIRISYFICSLRTRDHTTSRVILFFFPNPLIKDLLYHGFLVAGNVMRWIYIQ